MFELKPDFDRVLARFEAWWSCAVLDRPLVSLAYARPAAERVPGPVSRHARHRDRWLDVDFQVAAAEARLANAVWGGDALPVAWPNLGPEVFSSFYGCPLVFTETTSWSEPILASWDDAAVAGLRLDEEGESFRKLLELTDALIDAGRGRFLVGYTDLHPGGDAVAALRDPQQLCLDVLEHPRELKALVERVTDDFLRVYDAFHERLAAAGMPSVTWLPAIGRGRVHVPSNDFSCMISSRQFCDLFRPGLERECRHMDRCIYHLDGPGALRHLDAILELDCVQAVQWVPGAGRDRWSDWVGVYRRIQAAGRALVLYPPVEDLERVFAALRPEGVWLAVSGVGDAATADAALAAASRWTRAAA